MGTNELGALAAATENAWILGAAVICGLIAAIFPKILKFMNQKRDFETQRFEQEMERHKLLADVVKENTRVHVELKAALEGYIEIIKTTLKNDREMVQSALVRVNQKLDFQKDKTAEILNTVKQVAKHFENS